MQVHCPAHVNDTTAHVTYWCLRNCYAMSSGNLQSCSTCFRHMQSLALACVSSAQIRWVSIQRHAPILSTLPTLRCDHLYQPQVVLQIGTGARMKALSTQGGQSMRGNIANVFGARTVEALMPMDAPLGDAGRASGYVYLCWPAQHILLSTQNAWP